ncbi:DUF2158 domain-containing protein [Candidatus Saccharibacteria bacterium]|nr:DUF2158 domain-containing protein [Candidatus Saccharibacteria bacterium]
MTELAPGDVVTVKSGSQKMTIVEVTGDHAKCFWIDALGRARTEEFPIVVLKTLDASKSDLAIGGR